MNMLSWETEVQRRRDMQRKAQSVALGEIALAANRQRRKAHFLHLYRSVLNWLRKRLSTSYNQTSEIIQPVQSVVQADPPLR